MIATSPASALSNDNTPACYVLKFGEAVRLRNRYGPKDSFLLIGATDEALRATALTFSRAWNQCSSPLVSFGEGEPTGSKESFKRTLRDQVEENKREEQEGQYVVLRNVNLAPRDVLSTVCSLLDTGFSPLPQGGLLDLRAYHFLLTAPVPYAALYPELTSRVICRAFFDSQSVPPMQPAFSAA